MIEDRERGMSQNLIETAAEAAFKATRLVPWSDVDPNIKPLLLKEQRAAILAFLNGIQPNLGSALAEVIRQVNERRGVFLGEDPVHYVAGLQVIMDRVVDALRAEIESAP